MRTHQLVVGAVGIGALVASVGLPAASEPATPRKHDGLRTVTLITGDRVETSPDLRQVRFIPGPGRRDVRFSVRRLGGTVSVVPADAGRLLATGRLDRRLFELRELLRYDATRELPVIVQYSGSQGRAAVRTVDAGAWQLAAINGAAMKVPEAKTSRLFAELNSSAIGKIWLDGRRKPVLDQSTQQIGAPKAWAAGFTGRGVKVAVLDGGIDAAHPDFKDRLTTADFTGDGLGDTDGHGTHVASTVAGSGAASENKYRGVAPDAQILAGKVCGLDDCPESAILAGMDWAVAQGAKVVNLSLGGADDPHVDDPLEQAVNNLSAAHGTLFVVAAGNSGPQPESIGSPGSAAAALTIGAVDRSDKIAEFSSRGPVGGNGTVKPDVTAPGVGIVAAKASTSSIGKPVGTSYLRLSGTSMATPHAAGAAALLAQQHPQWSGAQLKAALIGSAHEVPGAPMSDQGAGRVDLGSATKLSVVSTTGAVGYDEQRWPHTDDKPQPKTVTYTNDSDQLANLTLDARLTDPNGQQAPETAVQLSTKELTVPAHGTAQVVVTSNTNHGGPDGQYVGKLTAQVASGGSLTTTLAVLREAESYDLTVRHLDRTGAPTTDYYDTLIDRDATDARDGSQFGLNDGEGYRIRLPKGRYLLESFFGTEVDAKESTQLILPKLDLTADRSIVIDARAAKPVKITVPGRQARNNFTHVSYELVTPRFTWGGGMGGYGDPVLFTAQLGATVPNLSGNLHSEFATVAPDTDGVYWDSPVVYQLNWSKLNGSFDGFTKSVRDSELATVRPTFTAGARPADAVWSATRISPRIGIDFVHPYPYRKLPATPAIKVTIADDFRWSPSLRYYDDTGRNSFGRHAITCRAGQTCAVAWGNAVVTPVLAEAWTAPFQSDRTVNSTDLSRTGDTLTFAAEGGDASGHVHYSGRRTFTLSRDGGTPVEVPPGEPSTIDVPAGPASYHLELTTTDSGPLDLSDHTRTAWTFKSGTTSSKSPLPLWTIAYHPPVDATNIVHAGPTHQLPFTLKPLLEAKVGHLTTVTLQTSTDGTTWHPAEVRRTSPGKYIATITTPANPTTISLQTTATDINGNTITQQINNAYPLTR